MQNKLHHLFSNKYTIQGTGYQKSPKKSLHDKAERNTDTRETKIDITIKH